MSVMEITQKLVATLDEKLPEREVAASVTGVEVKFDCITFKLRGRPEMNGRVFAYVERETGILHKAGASHLPSEARHNLNTEEGFTSAVKVAVASEDFIYTKR